MTSTPSRTAHGTTHNFIVCSSMSGSPIKKTPTKEKAKSKAKPKASEARSIVAPSSLAHDYRVLLAKLSPQEEKAKVSFVFIQGLTMNHLDCYIARN